MIKLIKNLCLEKSSVKSIAEFFHGSSNRMGSLRPGLSFLLLLSVLFLLAACSSFQPQEESGTNPFNFAPDQAQGVQAGASDSVSTEPEELLSPGTTSPSPLSSDLSAAGSQMPSQSEPLSEPLPGEPESSPSAASGKKDIAEEMNELRISAGFAPFSPRELESLRDSMPKYLRTGDENNNEEPPVPLSYPKENSLRGIAGRKVERFFKTLSTDPVYYHYARHPGDFSKGDELIQEVLIALSGKKSYMRLSTERSVLGILQTEASFYYQMDLLGGSYDILPGTEYNEELSMEAFSKIAENGDRLILTGQGNAVFMGRNVTFEEFTEDGITYIRYYFIGDAVVGHRSFKDGKVLETFEIFEASNRSDDSLFELPEGFRPSEELEEEDAKREAELAEAQGLTQTSESSASSRKSPTKNSVTTSQQDKKP